MIFQIVKPGDMCGRYILVQKKEIIEKRFNVTFDENVDYKPGYNISPGKMAAVITDNNQQKVQLLRFGLTPFWSKKNMMFINARTEGDHNKENDPDYTGARGIIKKPAFRKPIRSQRCLVLADAFIEGTTKEKLSKPFLVYLREKERPFAFAGIWDTWQNPETEEYIHSFAIITTVANQLLQKIPHHRSPVILPRQYEKKWLRMNLPLSDVTAMLEPYPAEKMNAYPIAPTIKNPKYDSKDLIKPIGERLEKEYEVKTTSKWELSGMGAGKRYSHDPDQAWGKKDD
ncbi:MAG: SOS response-associated peptidase [Bacteroidota bacterium]|nr:SOS response-associated peptidase [Bacteroidota bacterium]